MFTKQINIRTIVIAAMALALFLQSACTLHEVMAREKVRALWMNDRDPDHPEQVVEFMKYMNANTLVYTLLCQDENETPRRGNPETLEKFLQYNASLGSNAIDVWALTYATVSYPYKGDYIAWAQYFASVSLKYPQLKAYGPNDFYPDKHTTPAKLKNVLDVKDAINSKLKFNPTLYYDARNGLQWFMDGNAYDPLLSREGTMMWYWSSYSGGPDMSLKQLDRYLTQANQEIPPASFFTGLYNLRFVARELGWPDDSLFHHPDTLRKMLKMSLERSDGVVLWIWAGHWMDGDIIKANCNMPWEREEFQQVFKIIKEVFGAAAQPGIELSSNSLYFTAVQGGLNPIPQQVIVTSLGGLTLAGLTAVSNRSWLQVSVSGSGNTRILMNHVNLSLATKSDTAVVTVKAGNVTEQYIISLTLHVPSISLCPLTNSNGFGISGVSMTGLGMNFMVFPEKRGAYGLAVYDIVGRKLWEYQGKAAGAGIHSVAWNCNDGATHSQIQGLYYVVFEQGNKERLQRFLNMN